MKNQFAKLFYFPDGQLLVIKEYDPIAEIDKLTFKTVTDNLDLQQIIKFPKDQSADETFNEFDNVAAVAMYEEMQEVLNL